MIDFKGLYQSLKGSRVKDGALTIPDFMPEEYEELYYTLLEILKPAIGNNYEGWYMKNAQSFRRYKIRSNHTYDFWDPQTQKPVHMQTIQEQLANIKYYLQRRAYSAYPLKCEGDTEEYEIGI